MGEKLWSILNHINQGVIITNNKLEIVFINKFMENILDIGDENLRESKIYRAIPRFNKAYLKNAMKTVIEDDYKFFFSSSMHKNLISDNMEFNIKLTRFKEDNLKYLVIEFIDVTSQIRRIDQYKKYNEQLRALNKELKEKEAEIEKLAYYDGLTGLANRTLFYKLAQQYLTDAVRNKRKMGLMFIDVNEFKEVNDLYGHMIGDRVLVKIGKILKENTRENDIICRQGGDEFVIFLPDIDSHSNYKVIASRIAKANKTIKVNNIEIHISLSIGISFFPEDGRNIDELISKADRAMYQAKEIGGSKCRYHSCARI